MSIDPSRAQALRQRLILQKQLDRQQLESIKDSVQLAAGQVRDVWIKTLRERVGPKPDVSLIPFLFELFITVVPFGTFAKLAAGTWIDAVIGRLMRTRAGFAALPLSKSGRNLHLYIEKHKPDELIPKGWYRQEWKKMGFEDGTWLDRIPNARALYHPLIQKPGAKITDTAVSLAPVVKKGAKAFHLPVSEKGRSLLGLELDEPPVQLTRSVLAEVRAQDATQSLVWDLFVEQVERSIEAEDDALLSAIEEILESAEEDYSRSRRLEAERLDRLGAAGYSYQDLQSLQYEFAIWRLYFPRRLATGLSPVPPDDITRRDVELFQHANTLRRVLGQWRALFDVPKDLEQYILKRFIVLHASEHEISVARRGKEDVTKYGEVVYDWDRLGREMARKMPPETKYVESEQSAE